MTKNAEEVRRNFGHTVATVRRGRLTIELDEELRRLVQLCKERNTKGSLTLTLTIGPGKSAAFEITDEVKVTAPKVKKPVTLMYPTEDGFLSRSDPSQDDLPGIRAADAPEAQRAAS